MTPSMGDTSAPHSRFDLGTPQHLVELTIPSRFSTSSSLNPFNPNKHESPYDSLSEVAPYPAPEVYHVGMVTLALGLIVLVLFLMAGLLMFGEDY